jgi:hypothetical protein
MKSTSRATVAIMATTNAANQRMAAFWFSGSQVCIGIKGGLLPLGVIE